MKFSVLMSLYYKEKTQNLRECMESLLTQTVLPTEIVIVEDGPLTEELDAVLDEYVDRCQDDTLPDIQLVKLPENKGLGLALAEGMKHCTYNLVARMDTDDISAKNRFELQLKEFEKNPELDVIGGFIAEFSVDPDHLESTREVPLTQKDIYHYQRKRDALNHVSVMFKRDEVLAAGNYQSALLMEDSLLWANMIRHHAVMHNISDVLVYVRTGEDMLKRRGGLDYFRKYRKGRKQILATGTISRWDYLFTVLVQFAVCVMPLSMRRFVFQKLLRRS